MLNIRALVIPLTGLPYFVALMIKPDFYWVTLCNRQIAEAADVHLLTRTVFSKKLDVLACFSVFHMICNMFSKGSKVLLFFFFFHLVYFQLHNRSVNWHDPQTFNFQLISCECIHPCLPCNTFINVLALVALLAISSFSLNVIVPEAQESEVRLCIFCIILSLNPL